MVDFDPEEDGPAEHSDNGDSDESDDGLAGTEHYGEVRYIITSLCSR
jgi:protein AATF/BFR2